MLIVSFFNLPFVVLQTLGELRGERTMTLSCSEDGSIERCEGTAPAGTPESIDEIVARHKKEKKELQGKITGMKKGIPKGNNKKKKEVTEEVARLEAEQNARHAQELARAEANNVAADTPVEAPDTEPSTPDNESATKMSKAQKRREKKLEEERRRDAVNKEAAVAARTAPGMREKQAISEILAARSLQIRNIEADGDCMYNALAHQLSRSMITSGKEVRKIACMYIKKHKSEVLPYLTTVDGNVVQSDEDFKEYCNTVRLTSCEGGVWGGDVELRAISQMLKRKIDVIHGDGQRTTYGEDFEDPDPLVVTYHQRAYSLGAHYNSTEPLSKSEEDNF